MLLRDGNRQIVIQAKQYTSSVGFEAVKEAYFALGYYDADEAWVVTTSSFTQQAINAAKKTGVRLVSGSELDTLIAKARDKANESRPRKQTANREKSKRAEPSNVEASTRRAAGCSTENRAFLLCGEKSSAPCNVLVSYTGNSSIVETPADVDAIGEGSFSGRNLRKIVIHEGIRHIGDGAFSNCKKLETVQLPTTLVSIGDDAFSGCDHLRSIHLPAALVSIGARAFSGCSNLKEATMMDNVQSIGNSAFEHSGITTLALPKSLETLGSGAFAWSALERADLSSRIDEIPEKAFEYCPKLRQVTLPSGIKRIGASAFSHAAVTSIDFPDGLEDICHHAFSFCKSLRLAPLPSSIKNVCRSAFSTCSSLDDPDVDDALYSHVIVRDDAIPEHWRAISPDSDTKQIVSERDALFSSIMVLRLGILSSRQTKKVWPHTHFMTIANSEMNTKESKPLHQEIRTMSCCVGEPTFTCPMPLPTVLRAHRHTLRM